MRPVIGITTVLLPLGCAAQLLTNNGVTITVESGAQFTVQGDVLATAGAAIANSGTLDLSGDLTNNSGSGLFTAVAGDVIMNGGTQVIGGSAPTLFDDLDLQCASLTLQQDVQVGGAYPLPAGVFAVHDAIVQLNAHRLTVSNAATGAITRNTGQLVSESVPLSGYGEVAWNIGSATGAHVVPFGTGATYLPVTLDISLAGAGPGSFVFATYPTDPFASPNNRPLPTGLLALMDISGMENAPNVLDRFWPLTAPGFTTAPTAAITFTYRDGEWNGGTNTILEGTLQAQRFNGSQWSQPPNGLANTVSNTVTTSPSNNFDLVWALTQSSAVLPVELLYFDARIHGDDVRCTWATATEINNDFFTVERSADGSAFAEIGEVDGAGNSQNTNAYTFVDEAPLPGLSYYRLRQTDFDGTETRSDMVPVWREAAEAALVLFPNPARGSFTIAGAPGDAIGVRLLDATGRAIRNWPNRSVFELDGIAPGTYLVSVERAHAAPITERLVVE